MTTPRQKSKWERIHVRITLEEKRTIQRMAEKSDLTFSDYVRGKVFCLDGGD